MANTDQSFIQHAGQVVDRISWAAIFLAGVLMLAVAVFMSFEAFSRHFLDQPTSWVLAVSILIFMWFIFPCTSCLFP